MDGTALTRGIIDFALASAPSEQGFRPMAERLVGGDYGFDHDAAVHLADCLLSRYSSAEARSFCARLRTPYAKYLLYHLQRLEKREKEALDSLSDLIESLPRIDEWLLLERAKLFCRQEEFGPAFQDFRQCLVTRPGYAFFLKAEKLVERIIRQGGLTFRRIVRVALLTNASTQFLIPVLRATLLAEGVRAEFHAADFGAYRQEILTPDSELYRFSPDIVVMVPHALDFSDFSLSRYDPDAIAREMLDMHETISSRCSAKIVQLGVALNSPGAWGLLEDSAAGAKGDVIRRINTVLVEQKPANVFYLDANRILGKTGEDGVPDRHWFATRQYPPFEALPELACSVGGIVLAILGLSAKVVVVDLDNTLWGGVIGEDGLRGIRLGPPSPEGEGYQVWQKYLKGLTERGILLAVCSKNNMEDALLPFEQHDAMILKKNDMVIFKANWKDKATNVREIADELSLGLDSFIFVDDNPLERNWVRKALPEVRVPECGEKPWEMMRSLQNCGILETVAVTPEDQDRHRSYVVDKARKDLQKRAGSLDEFLHALHMEARSGEVGEATLARVSQLINKTNQFNLTTRRYTEEQVREMVEAEQFRVRWYSLADKYGDYGLIGVIIARKEAAHWTVDTWLMSCRVLGRKMEEFMCSDLLAEAEREGVLKVYGQYCRTAKNGQVSDLLPRLGFEAVDGNPDRYCFDLTKNERGECHYIGRAE